MAKRDFYETLGRRPRGLRRRDQEGLSHQGQGAAPRPQQRRPAGRGPVQGGQRGLRRPQGRAEEGGLRPLRPCRLRGRHGRRGRARAARASGRNGDFASAFSDVFDDLFGDIMGGRGGGQGPGTGGRARQRPALQPAHLARGGLCGPPEDHPGADRRHLHASARASGAEGGSEPQTCPTCSGMGKVRAQQGFFTVERTCPTCNGLGQIDQEPLQGLPRRGPRREGEDAVGQHPRRGRDRHAHPARRRGRGGAARRPHGRPLHLRRGEGALDLRARRGGPALPRAGLDGHGRARRRHRGADHRRRPRPREDPRGLAVRPPDAPARQGDAGAPLQGRGRHVHRARRSRRR